MNGSSNIKYNSSETALQKMKIKHQLNNNGTSNNNCEIKRYEKINFDEINEY